MQFNFIIDKCGMQENSTFVPVALISGDAVKVFFQTQTAFMKRFGKLLTYITVVPRFIDDARDFTFFVGVAKDEAVAPAIFHEPLLSGSSFLLGIQLLIAFINDVHRKTQFMLAGAGISDSLSGFNFSFFTGIALSDKVVDTVLV